MAAREVVQGLEAQVASLVRERSRIDKAITGIEAVIRGLVGGSEPRPGAVARVEDLVPDPLNQGVGKRAQTIREKQRWFLAYLFEHETATQRAMRLASPRRLFKSAGSVYHIEQQLTGAGLVKRAGKDGRSPIYQLTSQGEAVARKLAAADAPEPEPEPEVKAEPEPEAKPAPKPAPKRRARKRRPGVKKTPYNEQLTAAQTQRLILDALSVHGTDPVMWSQLMREAEARGVNGKSPFYRNLGVLIERGTVFTHKGVIDGKGDSRTRWVSLRPFTPHREYGVTVRPGEPFDNAERHGAPPA